MILRTDDVSGQNFPSYIEIEPYLICPNSTDIHEIQADSYLQQTGRWNKIVVLNNFSSCHNLC